MQCSFANLPWLPPVPADLLARCKQLDPASWLAGNSLQLLASYNLSAAQSLTFSRALSRCRKAGGSFTPLSEFRLGVLASNTVDLVVDCLPAACARHGVAADIVTAPYDQVVQQALDPRSLINTARLDAVLIAVDHHWLALDYSTLDQQAELRIDGAMQRLRAVVDGLRANSGAAAILQTVPPPPQALFGNYDRLVHGTVRDLIGRCNQAITAIARETGSYLLDTAALAERIGLDHWFNPIQWTSYRFPFDANCCPAYAETVGRLVGAIRGKARKCLVLDLDNTIWGGVIGDDGIEGIVVGQGNARGEAFLAVQRFALELRERGVMLAVSSKNNDETARRPFREHTEMALREQHISVLQANWLDKPSNLESIAKTLNIGLDALVLLDDNPAERAQVRAALPMVAVPELPEDPNWYAWTLGAAGYFEAVTFAAEDRLRSDAVAADARRTEVMAKSRDLGDYLSSLDMVITFAPFDQLGRQRIAQLINKTNQFNLTTRRYTEAQVAVMEADGAVFTLQARLKDSFGDLGMIGVAICRPDEEDKTAWTIDTWLMSCRVLGRCVEQAMLARIVAEASRRGIQRLIGWYVPTPKNGMVANHYEKLGFEKLSAMDNGATCWRLQVKGHSFPHLPMTVAKEAMIVSNNSAVDETMAGTTSSAALEAKDRNFYEDITVAKSKPFLIADPVEPDSSVSSIGPHQVQANSQCAYQTRLPGDQPGSVTSK
jgi:FkbH-like protein